MTSPNKTEHRTLVTRRSALTSATALAATLLIPKSFAAKEGVAPAFQQAGFRRLSLGDYKIIAVSDGTAVRRVDKLVTRIAAAEVLRLASASYRDAEMELSINTFLVDTGSTKFLIDTGAGDLFKPEAGLLSTNLQAAGYSAERIDAIVLTHIHADHSGGLMQAGRRVFPNARIHVPRKDFELYLDKDARTRALESQKHIYDDAEKCFRAYIDANQVKTFDWNQEILPGISSLPASGHTPGHSLIVVQSKGQRMVVLGDTVHVAEVQFPRPDAAVILDADQDAAVAQRARIFAEAAEKEWLVAFDHVSFPGIGHIRKLGAGYEWIPIAYRVQE